MNRENRDDLELWAELRLIRERYLALPLLDGRPADEIIGYDGIGLPSA